jgi:prophage regulatory protein
MTDDIEMMTRDEVRERVVDWSDEWFRRQEDAEKFPKRVRLGDNTVAYVKREVMAWLAARIAERDAAKPAAPTAKPEAAARAEGKNPPQGTGVGDAQT